MVEPTVRILLSSGRVREATMESSEQEVVYLSTEFALLLMEHQLHAASYVMILHSRSNWRAPSGLTRRAGPYS